ncbi:MAG: hypothetical protein ABSC49_02970 [Candidatus Microgenomates bacterium]|jgi:hypothetical protein
MVTNLSAKVQGLINVSTDKTKSIKERLKATESLAKLLLKAKEYSLAKENANNRIALALLTGNKYRVYLAHLELCDIAYFQNDGKALLEGLPPLIDSARKAEPVVKTEIRKRIVSNVINWNRCVKLLKDNLDNINNLGYE